MNPKDRFLSACKRKKVDRPPVWLMRQAGRYLPEYRLLRARHSFLEICKTPELACEATLQPLQRFEMDAAILFSDILIVPEAMGQKLSFDENKGPLLTPVLKSPADLAGLKKTDPAAAFNFVYDAISLLKKKLPKDVPLIGFAGGPWTLASYMTGDKLDEWLKKYPEDLIKLLDILADVVAEYLHRQQMAGCDVIQIFDTWSGELSKNDFKKLVQPNLKKIISKSRVDAPFIVYSRKCSHIMGELADTGADVISIDPRTKMEAAIKTVGDNVAIQGNIDPKVLLKTPGVVKEEVSRLLSKIQNRPGHIINSGHGVLPTTPVECVAAFVEAVHAFSYSNK